MTVFETLLLAEYTSLTQMGPVCEICARDYEKERHVEYKTRSHYVQNHKQSTDNEHHSKSRCGMVCRLSELLNATGKMKARSYEFACRKGERQRRRERVLQS